MGTPPSISILEYQYYYRCRKNSLCFGRSLMIKISGKNKLSNLSTGVKGIFSKLSIITLLTLKKVKLRKIISLSLSKFSNEIYRKVPNWLRMLRKNRNRFRRKLNSLSKKGSHKCQLGARSNRWEIRETRFKFFVKVQSSIKKHMILLNKSAKFTSFQ